jgi:arabinogalactan oligomer/maltooligosaccharide transport system permease protein
VIYRVLLVLPYAMPAFAMLLVWRDMFNTDFGLINRLFGLGVDWLGGPWTARGSVLLVNTWLGYPYMFLITTGALQAIPKEMTEAARIDGASPWHAFRKVTLPLLLTAVPTVLVFQLMQRYIVHGLTAGAVKG